MMVSSLKVNGMQVTSSVLVVPNGVPRGSVRVKSKSIFQPENFGSRNRRRRERIRSVSLKRSRLWANLRAVEVNFRTGFLPPP